MKYSLADFRRAYPNADIIVGPSAALPRAEPAKRSKYGAVKTVVDGMTFASKREARRYLELKTLQAAGKISGLGMQPTFTLTMEGGKNVGVYKADFVYLEDGVKVVEDCKGFRTTAYRLKKRMFEAQYGIKIRET